ncbi:MAG TPA: murein biosynthesis integral membrane protein MurJ, partial [Beijerinckiaceae bacterium]|nr:murein biosynthesis integral membrane protein MurJ [Beijerinckiaceae bacterium]
MLKNLLKVGGWTLVSRVTGFVRDILMAAILGAGPLMDAFAVAFRLPNHFRAIFAEGAFANAFVPAYTATRTQKGDAAAHLFHGRILTLLLVSQLVLLAVALMFTQPFVGLLAPGFKEKASVFPLAVELTRITFPYLMLITLVTIWADALASVKQFSAAAAAPVLLNLSMIATVAAAAWFKTPAHAAAWGVLLAGFLEAGLLFVAARRGGVLAAPKKPVFDSDVRAFFKAFGPAVIGSAGVQIAMLADTVIVTFLATGGASALYYADRLYQLPIGVIGVAAGTVLLPEMSRLIAASDPAGAHRAQNRAMGFTLLLTAPFVAAFVVIPDLIVAGLFRRGAFDDAAALATASVLAAYTVGLPAVVLIRSAVASFTARGDTRTPLWASLTAIACNLLLKLMLWRSMGAAGLALATAVGAWINFAILAVLALRGDKAAPDRLLLRTLMVATLAALALAG